jgi:hypothetical protein
MRSAPQLLMLPVLQYSPSMLSRLDSKLQILKKSLNIFPTFQVHALHYTPSGPSVLRAHGGQMICCIRLLLLANLSTEFEISVIRYASKVFSGSRARRVPVEKPCPWMSVSNHVGRDLGFAPLSSEISSSSTTTIYYFSTTYIRTRNPKHMQTLR